MNQLNIFGLLAEKDVLYRRYQNAQWLAPKKQLARRQVIQARARQTARPVTDT